MRPSRSRPTGAGPRWSGASRSSTTWRPTPTAASSWSRRWSAAGGSPSSSAEAARDLAGNLLEPQGLGFDSAGNVLVSETAAGRLDVFIRTFKLVPVGGKPAPGQPVCLTVFRAPGFTGDVQLAAGGGIEIVRQPGTGNTGEVLIQPSAGCANLGCVVTATSGALADSLWITG